MFDLDHFKHINDTWGHAQGDIVLQEFAQLLRESSRHIDTVGRYGGEEFVVVLPATDIEGARAFAEKARSATEEMEIRRVTGDAEILSPLRITVSGGAVVLEEHDDTAAAEAIMRGLMRAADSNLYAAKSGGRNQVVIDSRPITEIIQLGSSAGEISNHGNGQHHYGDGRGAV
jgi:diguanylate cyclase (GGDEF)-like protein